MLPVTKRILTEIIHRQKLYRRPEIFPSLLPLQALLEWPIRFTWIIMITGILMIPEKWYYRCQLSSLPLFPVVLPSRLPLLQEIIECVLELKEMTLILTRMYFIRLALVINYNMAKRKITH